ncbi:hypothetical protein E2C01_025954 [Portunus trituberculatus]|uniref:Uncharacterized protein n=1 Tax=Portunus trituberculatus TaxID=210409 RepID=A0A5B7EET6_PORTR|nr:hypothetical protein [Portunus trituberculatus]
MVLRASASASALFTSAGGGTPNENSTGWHSRVLKFTKTQVPVVLNFGTLTSSTLWPDTGHGGKKDELQYN